MGFDDDVAGDHIERKIGHERFSLREGVDSEVFSVA